MNDDYTHDAFAACGPREVSNIKTSDYWGDVNCVKCLLLLPEQLKS